MAVRNGTSGLYNEEYSVNNVENAATTYIGKVTPRGTWLIQRYVDATGVFDYANLSNNVSTTTYGAAWTNRAALAYAAFEDLAGV
jgi:hypothetical protein